MHKVEVELERSNSLKTQITRTEEEKKFWLEKSEFLEGEIRTQWLRQEEANKENSNDKNKDFNLCISGCELLKSAASFVLSYGAPARLGLSGI